MHLLGATKPIHIPQCADPDIVIEKDLYTPEWIYTFGWTNMKELQENSNNNNEKTVNFNSAEKSDVNESVIKNKSKPNKHQPSVFVVDKNITSDEIKLIPRLKNKRSKDLPHTPSPRTSIHDFSNGEDDEDEEMDVDEPSPVTPKQRRSKSYNDNSDRVRCNYAAVASEKLTMSEKSVRACNIFDVFILENEFVPDEKENEACVQQIWFEEIWGTHPCMIDSGAQLCCCSPEMAKKYKKRLKTETDNPIGIRTGAKLIYVDTFLPLTPYHIKTAKPLGLVRFWILPLLNHELLVGKGTAKALGITFWVPFKPI